MVRTLVNADPSTVDKWREANKATALFLRLLDEFALEHDVEREALRASWAIRPREPDQHAAKIAALEASMEKVMKRMDSMQDQIAGLAQALASGRRRARRKG